MTEISITLNQLNLMAHALGGKIPEKWNRNNFCVYDNSDDLIDLILLEKMGLMERGERSASCINLVIFRVTNEGKRWFE